MFWKSSDLGAGGGGPCAGWFAAAPVAQIIASAASAAPAIRIFIQVPAGGAPGIVADRRFVRSPALDMTRACRERNAMDSQPAALKN
jgi:hypothetical protein